MPFLVLFRCVLFLIYSVVSIEFFQKKEPQQRGLLSAEREGFEPSVPLRIRVLSRDVPSATQPPFQRKNINPLIVSLQDTHSLINTSYETFHRWLSLKARLGVFAAAILNFSHRSRFLNVPLIATLPRFGKILAIYELLFNEVGVVNPFSI